MADKLDDFALETTSTKLKSQVKEIMMSEPFGSDGDLIDLWLAGREDSEIRAIINESMPKAFRMCGASEEFIRKYQEGELTER